MMNIVHLHSLFISVFLFTTFPLHVLVIVDHLQVVYQGFTELYVTSPMVKMYKTNIYCANISL
jgi:hypothetical protein